MHRWDNSTLLAAGLAEDSHANNQQYNNNNITPSVTHWKVCSVEYEYNCSFHHCSEDKYLGLIQWLSGLVWVFMSSEVRPWIQWPKHWHNNHWPALRSHFSLSARPGLAVRQWDSWKMADCGWAWEAVEDNESIKISSGVVPGHCCPHLQWRVAAHQLGRQDRRDRRDKTGSTDEKD